MTSKSLNLALTISLFVAMPLQASLNIHVSSGTNKQQRILKQRTHNDECDPKTKIAFITSLGIIMILPFVLLVADVETSYGDTQYRTLPLDNSTETANAYSDDAFPVHYDPLVGTNETHGCKVNKDVTCTVYRLPDRYSCSYNLDQSGKEPVIKEKCSKWQGSHLRDFLTTVRLKIWGKTEEEKSAELAEIIAALQSDNEPCQQEDNPNFQDHDSKNNICLSWPENSTCGLNPEDEPNYQ